MTLKIRSIWDNEGETIDRYTVVTASRSYNEMVKFNGNPVYLGLSFSENCNSPQGVSMFGACVEGDHLGTKVELKDLSPKLQDHIAGRLK